jgi:two-component system, LuxR family, sensor kinase FixL
MEKRAMDTGRVLNLVLGDGSTILTEIKITALPQTEYLCVKINRCDIDEFWQKNQRASKNAEYLRAMFDQAIVGIVQTDLLGNITHVNQHFSEITEYTKDQLLGINLRELIHPDEQQRFIELFQELIKNNLPFTLETRYLCKNVRHAWVNISISRINDALRQPSNCVAIVVDVTERTITALALQSSKELLTLAEAATNFGIYDINLINQHIHCNQRLRDIWGFSADETITLEKFRSGIHSEDRVNREQLLSEYLTPEGLGQFHLEYRVLQPQGHDEIWVSSIGRGYFLNNQLTRIVGIIQDISNHKKNVLAKQKNGLAIKALHHKQLATQTISAIAHELNQPLTAISAYSEFAYQSLSDKSPDLNKIKQAVQDCAELAQHAGQILHELLNFLHQDKITTELLDINIFIRETISIAQNNSLGSFQTQLHLQPGLPLVRTNRLQIQLALTNVLRNSLEAMRDAGMEPKTILISIKTTTKLDMILITVQDNGPGLSPDIAKRIFDPFFTTKTGGIGMGLAISRALIEANDGQLWLDQNYKLGATFHITLPISL